MEKGDDCSASSAECIVHASCVEIDGKGLLITGPSGSGKSAVALDLMAVGGCLVSDDRTVLRRNGSAIYASPPETIAGLIEARFVGLMRVPFSQSACINLVIDLGQQESERLPPTRHVEILGQRVTLIYRPPGVLQPAAILHCLLERRIET